MSSLQSDRDTIIAFLAHAYSRDKLDLREYERRLETANGATAKDELEAFVEDLVIDGRELAEEESVLLKMDERTFSRGSLLTKKLVLTMKYSTIVLDYSDIELPDGKYELQFNGDISKITIRLPIHFKLDNQLSSQMVTLTEATRDEGRPWERNVTIKLTGKLKKSEVKIIRGNA